MKQGDPIKYVGKKFGKLLKDAKGTVDKALPDGSISCNFPLSRKDQETGESVIRAQGFLLSEDSVVGC